MLRRTESIVEKMLTNWLVGYHYLILLISLTFLIILIFLVMVLTNRLVSYDCLIISYLSKLSYNSYLLSYHDAHQQAGQSAFFSSSLL